MPSRSPRQRVAVHCAGPFRAAETTLLEACLEVGCHYADIADDRSYAVQVRAFGERFADRGFAAVYGCSSLPGISGALALRAARSRADRAVRARVTLFIGNDNPKGSAAITLACRRPGPADCRATGRRFAGFAIARWCHCRQPFGRRAVFNFDSPDYDLLPAMVGVRIGER